MKTRPLRPTGLTIGDVAARTGLAHSAIRYYESEGLIAPYRTAAGQRGADPAKRKTERLGNADEREPAQVGAVEPTLAGLPDGRPPSKSDWTRISHGFRRDLDARIAELETLRDRLDGCIGCGCLSLEACALYNPDDRAAGHGAGPRYLMGDIPPD